MKERRVGEMSKWKAQWRAELKNKQVEALPGVIRNYLRANLLIVGGNLSPEKKPYVIQKRNEFMDEIAKTPELSEILGNFIKTRNERRLRT